MIGKIFRATWDEYRNGEGGWEFVLANKSRWESFSFEESSIDLGITCTPRIIVDDIEYDVQRQYFIKDSDTQTTRLMFLYPVKKPTPVVETTEDDTEIDNSGELTGTATVESNGSITNTGSVTV
jgi:hypothetical protein